MNQEQNYNNLLNYIKMRLGAPLNMIEFSDDDLVNYIREHILPEFSNYVPAYYRVPITSDEQVTHNFNDRTYVLILPDTVKVLTVANVYYTSSSGSESITDDLGQSVFYYGDTMDILALQQYTDALESLSSVQAFEYIPPSSFNNFNHLIRFDKPLSGGAAIVELEIIHYELGTIPSEVYMYFKKWCLKEVVELIIVNRSKYERLSTNIGEINLNIQYLENMKNELSQEIEQWKDNFLVDKVNYVWL